MGWAVKEASPKQAGGTRPGDSAVDQPTTPLVSRVIGSRATGGLPCSPRARISPAKGTTLTALVPCGTPAVNSSRVTSPRPHERQSPNPPSLHSNSARPARSSARYLGVRTQRLRKSARPSRRIRAWIMPSRAKAASQPWRDGRFQVGPLR